MRELLLNSFRMIIGVLLLLLFSLRTEFCMGGATYEFDSDIDSDIDLPAVRPPITLLPFKLLRAALLRAALLRLSICSAKRQTSWGQLAVDRRA